MSSRTCGRIVDGEFVWIDNASFQQEQKIGEKQIKMHTSYVSDGEAVWACVQEREVSLKEREEKRDKTEREHRKCAEIEN